MNPDSDLKTDRPSPINPHGYFRRQWPIFLLLIVFAVVATNQWLFTILGTLIYVPVLGLLAFVCAGLTRRLFNKNTTESDASDGTFDRNWDALATAAETPGMRFKVAMHMIQFFVYFIGYAMIAAAVMGK